MDRTVYYNTDTMSNFSEDSYNSSPHYSPKNNASKSFDRYKVKDNNNKRVVDLGRAINDKLLLSQQKRVVITGSSNPKGKKSHDKIQDRPLTRKILHSGISHVAVPRKEEMDMELHYGSVLVLHLQCKNITAMTPSSLDPFYNLKNLYLYKNSIRRIQGLDNLVNLELLDLSRNNIERIDNLDKCTRLKKLYLGFNEIQVIEGLENLQELEEFLVDDQDIPPEQPLIFIPGIMEYVGNTLLTLDISSNNLSNLKPLSTLVALQSLTASNNLLTDLDDVINTLTFLNDLRTLNLKGNPIASRPTYKSRMIGSIRKLETLDGKEILEATRNCVQKLRFLKESRQKEQQRKEVTATATAQQFPPNMSSCPYKLDPNYTLDFNFSTPTRASPVMGHGRGQRMFPDQSSYTPRARSTSTVSSLCDPTESQQMSDMAKIIFRLSNLDQPNLDGSGDAKNYWDTQPGSSMKMMTMKLGESGEEDNDDKRTTTRPRPPGPGGRSMNMTMTMSNEGGSGSGCGFSGSRYMYGRTLSPLIEMPTPESLTARDEN